MTWLLILLVVAAAAAADNCAICHEDPKFRVQHKALYEYSMAFESSAHGEAGLDCNDCHGGDATATDLDVVHDGVMDPVRYDCIPGTCGECHDEQYEAFASSRHSKELKDDGAGPNCVTCHGAMDMSVISVTDVRDSCLECHAEGSDIDTEVPDRAEHILRLINNIKGYRKFVSKHGDDKQFGKRTDEAYDKLTKAWHQFDLEDVAIDAETLLAELRQEKDRIIAQRRQR